MRSRRVLRRVLRNQKNKRNTKNLRKRTNFRKLANAKTRRLRARSKVGTKRRYTKKNKKGGSAPRVPPRATKYKAIVFDVDDTLYPHICGHNISFDDENQTILIERIKEILKFLKARGVIFYVVTRCRPSQNILKDTYATNENISYTLPADDPLIPEENIFGADWVDSKLRIGVNPDVRVWNVTNAPFDKNYSVIKSEFLNQIRTKHSGENILFVDDDSANAVVAASRGFDCITSPDRLGKAGGMIMTIRGLEKVFGEQPDFPKGSLSKYPTIMGGRMADVVQSDSDSDSFKLLVSTQQLTFMKCVNNLAKYRNSDPRVEVTLESQVFDPQLTKANREPLDVTFQSIVRDITNLFLVTPKKKFVRKGAMKKRKKTKEQIYYDNINEFLGEILESVDDCEDEGEEGLGLEVSNDLRVLLETPDEIEKKKEMLKRVGASFKVKPRAACRTTTGEQRDIVVDAICEFKYKGLTPIPYTEGIDTVMLKDKLKGSWFLRTSSTDEFTIVIKITDETDSFDKLNPEHVVKYKIKKEEKNESNKYFIYDTKKFDDFKSLLTYYSKINIGEKYGKLDPNKLLMEEDQGAPPLPIKGK
jgi:hypothetical protein